MRDEAGRALAALLALVTVVAAVEAVVLFRMDARVRSLEDGTLADESGGPAPDALARELASIRERVEVNARLVRKSGERADRRLDALETSIAADAAPAGAEPAGAPDAAGVSPADLKEFVAAAVDEKLEKELLRGDGEWKGSLQQLTEALELNEYQTLQSERILDDAKAEMFRLAGLKRADGTTKLDELVEAVTHPEDPEGAMKRWFTSLFTDRIPGRDETYIAEILRMKSRTESSLKEILDEKQAKKMLRMNVDYLGVKTSYDPFAEYLQESVR